MSFPRDSEELQTRIAEENGLAAGAAKVSRDLKEMARVEMKEAEEHLMIAEILMGLRDSWRQSDPGKNKPAFFLRSKGRCRGKRVVAQEFLPPDVRVCKTEEEWWEKYGHNEFPEYHVVPPFLPVISLQKVRTRKCPKCGTPQPLIESYGQDLETFDLFGRDQWMRQFLVLCLDCDKAWVVNTEYSNLRF